MKTRLLFLAAACCLLNFWVGGAAQRGKLRGPIHGRVTDSQGAPIPGVRVTLRDVSTGDDEFDDSERTTVTADDGSYVFREIREGKYILTFKVVGFGTSARRITHENRGSHTNPTNLFGGTLVNARLASGALPTPTPTATATPSPLPSPTPRPSPILPSSPTPTLTPTPTPTGTPPPLTTPTPTPTGTPQTKIDELLSGMELGQIAFNVPPSMSLEKAETVVLLLSPTQTVKQLEDTLRDEGAVGDLKNAKIKIHDRMQAELSGDGFLITRVTADTLPVSQQQTTEWRWDVRAVRAGTLKLNLVLNAIVDVDDGSGPRPYPIRTFSHTYLVKVSWRDGATSFFRESWPWLLFILAAPAPAWLWFRNKRRRRAARRVFSPGTEPGIFISYRREDTAGYVGRLYDDLSEHFGADRVFMDIGSIGYGEDFVAAMEKAIGSSAVFIVVIGKQWLSMKDEQGERRIDNPRDFVRQEVEIALRLGVKIIPVLVQGAKMPGEDALPAPLAKLARRNAIEFSDNRWQFDVAQLIEALEEELSKEPARPQPQGPASDRAAE